MSVATWSNVIITTYALAVAVGALVWGSVERKRLEKPTEPSRPSTRP